MQKIGEGWKEVRVEIIEVVVELVHAFMVFFQVKVFELRVLGHNFKKMFIRRDQKRC